MARKLEELTSGPDAGAVERRRAVPRDASLEVDAAGVFAPIEPCLLQLCGIGGPEAEKILRAPASERAAALLSAARRVVADAQTFTAAMNRTAAAGDEVTFDEFELRDGRSLECYGVPKHDSEGRFAGRAFSLRDVTARRRAGIEARERARQQEAVATLGELAMHAEGVEPLLHLAVRVLASTLGVDLVHLLELEPHGEAFRVRARSGDVDGCGGEAFPAADTFTSFTLAHQTPVVVLDLGEERRFAAPRLRTFGVVSAIGVVIRGRERPFGVLGAYAYRRRAFTSDEVHFVETVANVVAAALVRSATEAALVDRERQLRAVFENALDPIVTLDDAARVVEANAAACILFGRTRADVVGRRALPFFGDGAAGVGDAWQDLLTKGRLHGGVDLSPPGAAPRHVEFSAVARILPGLHLCVMRDVTEQRAMQSRLALADRMASVGTLAAGVAHELNNPLAYVTANLTWVSERLAADPALDGVEERDEILQALLESRGGAERMRDIIRDLRTFSRADETSSGPVELARVVESCISMAWNEIKHRARLVREFAEVPPAHGNEARVGQVILNLLVNAAQAIPEGAAERNEIRVAVRRTSDGRVEVAVSDTGCGIAPQHRRRIFDPFFTTKPLGVGTGLGLSICHNLVAAMGGAIELESETGRGSTFRVVLPASRGYDLAADRSAPPSAPRRARGRVLIVDDEPLVGAAVRRALASDHDVTVVPGAREALARVVSGERWDVVVSDLLMPDMTGIELHAGLARVDAQMAERMLFVTGGAFTPASRDFVEEHRASCIEKPFDLDALRVLVRRRLGGAARR